MRHLATIDFHLVEPHQRDMDRRLQNWARWSRGTNRVGDFSPMFRLAQATARSRGEVYDRLGGPALDHADASRVAKGVAQLPAANRHAVNWAYIKPVSPKRACQLIGTSMEGLLDLLRNGRQMLINAGV